MKIAPAFGEIETRLIELRRDLHQHPELGFTETRTSGIVAKLLEEWGLEVTAGVGKTGVVARLRRGEGKSIGLRADMDALPIIEAGDRPYASKNGAMHACGHDGHTAMLLGAAYTLSRSDRFRGTVNFIFQPAEEGLGGAKAMIADGLFERFPCERIYALHSAPRLPLGDFGIVEGTTLAGGALFEIRIEGRGAHGAKPEASVDPVLVGSQLVVALQSIVSRNTSALDTLVVSVTKFQSGSSFNVIPNEATLAGTVRGMSLSTIEAARVRLVALTEGICASFGAKATVSFDLKFLPTINEKTSAELAVRAASDIVGREHVQTHITPAMASEDFSFMLAERPGCFVNIGNGGKAELHNPHFDFDDRNLGIGASFFTRLVETVLGADPA